jgi:hypothetical protein
MLLRSAGEAFPERRTASRPTRRLDPGGVASAHRTPDGLCSTDDAVPALRTAEIDLSRHVRNGLAHFVLASESLGRLSLDPREQLLEVDLVEERQPETGGALTKQFRI